jgi:hypothetical protein
MQRESLTDHRPRHFFARPIIARTTATNVVAMNMVRRMNRPGPPMAEEYRKRASRDWPSFPTIKLDALQCAGLPTIA